jgi:hypothetical protein
LFLVEVRLPLSEPGHRLAEIGILLVVYGGISLWLKTNTGALIQEDMERWRAASRTVVKPISPPEHCRPDFQRIVI